MNRRSFFTKLGLAAASLSILPAATAYARNWKPASVASSILVPNPEWETATYVMEFVFHPKALELLGGDDQTVITANNFLAQRFCLSNGNLVRVDPFLKVPVDAFGNPN